MAPVEANRLCDARRQSSSATFDLRLPNARRPRSLALYSEQVGTSGLQSAKVEAILAAGSSESSVSRSSMTQTLSGPSCGCSSCRAVRWHAAAAQRSACACVNYFRQSENRRMTTLLPKASAHTLPPSILPTLPLTGFIRQAQVLTFIPISKSTLWRQVAAGTFPAPVKLTLRVTAWRAEDVRRWMSARSGATTLS